MHYEIEILSNAYSGVTLGKRPFCKTKFQAFVLIFVVFFLFVPEVFVLVQ